MRLTELSANEGPNLLDEEIIFLEEYKRLCQEHGMYLELDGAKCDVKELSDPLYFDDPGSVIEKVLKSRK